MDISSLASRTELDTLHREFDIVAESFIKTRMIFWRMHVNRIIQSVFILQRNPNIWKMALAGLTRSLGNKSSLRSLEIATTYRCNATCEQCSCRLEFDKEREKKELLSIDEFKSAIDQAVDMGAFQFGINGGEPLLNEEAVFELLHYIKQKHNSYTHLCTNGYLLTPEKIAKLKELQLDSVEMGLDSAYEKVHDLNRMPGSFNKILENASEFKKHKILVVLNTVLTNEKVCSDDMVLTYMLAKKLNCLLQITPACLTGAFKNRRDQMLTERTKLYFHWLLSKSWHNRSDLYSSLTKIRCPAAREKIGLQPYGDVVSCPLIQISYGNIRHRSLRDIQEEMLKNPYYHLKETQGCLPSMSEEFIERYLFTDKVVDKKAQPEALVPIIHKERDT